MAEVSFMALKRFLRDQRVPQKELFNAPHKEALMNLATKYKVDLEPLLGQAPAATKQASPRPTGQESLTNSPREVEALVEVALNNCAAAEATLDMLKATAVEDSNMAGVGSGEDKAARKQAAETEAAWEACGTAPGVKVWRIEQFEVKPWPVEEYGVFYEGDSYIVLHTSRDEGEEKLKHDIYFWLGACSTSDEQGTAAYKTVELDDLFDGAATQHRETMLHESAGFKELFAQLTYLKGGVDSGFTHVEEGAYVSKLLQVKKVGRQVNVIEVACERASLNSGDAFVLDTGAMLYVWNGDECSAFEAQAANTAAKAMEATRGAKATVTSELDSTFWNKLGGVGDITPASEAADVLPPAVERGEGVLYQLSDSTGELSVTEVARGELSAAMLCADDVFLCDAGEALLVWIGSGCSARESAAAMSTATKFLQQQQKPLSTTVSVLKEASALRNPIFREIFAA